MEDPTEKFKAVDLTLTDHEKRIRAIEKFINYSLGFVGGIIILWKLFSGH